MLLLVQQYRWSAIKDEIKTLILPVFFYCLDSEEDGTIVKKITFIHLSLIYFCLDTIRVFYKYPFQMWYI